MKITAFLHSANFNITIQDLDTNKVLILEDDQDSISIFFDEFKQIKDLTEAIETTLKEMEQ